MDNGSVSTYAYGGRCHSRDGDVTAAEKPLPAGQIRCVFIGGPLDGKTHDIDAYLPSQTPPEEINATDPVKWPGVRHEYRRDGDVEDRPGIGRHLLMRYDGPKPTPPTSGARYER